MTGKFQIFFGNFSGLVFQISGQSWIQFSVTSTSFSGIRRAVGRAVAAFFGMEVSMHVPGWHHFVQVYGVNADH